MRWSRMRPRCSGIRSFSRAIISDSLPCEATHNRLATLIVPEGGSAGMNQWICLRHQARGPLGMPASASGQLREATRWGGSARVGGVVVRTLLEAEPDRLHKVFRAGRDHLAAVVDIHHVIVQADGDEHGSREALDGLVQEAGLLTALGHDHIRLELPELFRGLGEVGVEAGDVKLLVPLQKAGNPAPEQGVSVNHCHASLAHRSTLLLPWMLRGCGSARIDWWVDSGDTSPAFQGGTFGRDEPPFL